MQIIRDNQTKVTDFENIECGGVFIYDKITYMKMDELLDTCRRNAVALGNGECATFHSSDKVQPVDAELHIL